MRLMIPMIDEWLKPSSRNHRIALSFTVCKECAPSRNRTGILPSGGECTIHYAMGAMKIIYQRNRLNASQMKMRIAQYTRESESTVFTAFICSENTFDTTTPPAAHTRPQMKHTRGISDESAIFAASPASMGMM